MQVLVLQRHWEEEERSRQTRRKNQAPVRTGSDSEKELWEEWRNGRLGERTAQWSSGASHARKPYGPLRVIAKSNPLASLDPQHPQNETLYSLYKTGVFL